MSWLYAGRRSPQKPTQQIRSGAADAGRYQSPWGRALERVQLFTVEELLNGARADYPHAANATCPWTQMNT